MTLSSKDDVHALTSSMKDKMCSYLCGKYSDSNVNELLCIATYVDPRFKSESLSTKESANVRSKIVGDKSMHANRDNSVKTQVENATPTKRSLASLFAKSKSTPNDDSNDVTISINRELSSYESAPCINSDANPMDC